MRINQRPTLGGTIKTQASPIPRPNAPWWLCAPPPYLLTDCTGQIGLVQGDMGKISALLDDIYAGFSALNNGEVDLALVSSKLLYLSLDARLSLDERPTLGATREREVGLWAWIKLEFVDEVGPQSIYAWTPLIMFVDDGLAVQTGRELLGFPKVQGNFSTRADQPNRDPSVTVRAMSMPKNGAVEAQLETVLSVDSPLAAPDRHPPSLAQLAIVFRRAMNVPQDMQEPDVTRGFDCICPRYQIEASSGFATDCTLVFTSISPPIPQSLEMPLYYGLLAESANLTVHELPNFPLQSALGISDNAPIEAGFWLYGVARLSVTAG
jgi:hypothetical protein